MAAIDKIYGTQKQYEEFENWLLENQKPIKCRTLLSIDDTEEFEMILPSDFLYDKSGYNIDHRPISNFPPEVDDWLKEFCPLDFIQEKLKEQYGE